MNPAFPDVGGVGETPWVRDTEAFRSSTICKRLEVRRMMEDDELSTLNRLDRVLVLSTTFILHYLFYFLIPCDFLELPQACLVTILPLGIDPVIDECP